ncbi:TetR/AcrR family transcriptional regulator [Nocardioides sp.]|uniref:TetR/AcrR family transcriptional regulator n=1 Tax=Nocardioides sp. TaxID=35761 RepID=UPI002D007ED9|nr:TetR family transcriptional regulator C-terminal domain-containing protein [Nocardioides sp.]HXH79885.1 TetR family transcriptional regulator C-terminal domain-containing protein [Nocardioides sp.]
MSDSPCVPHELSARRREILDAAVTVLADLGWRGLTHRAIDREAGLPEGSSSAYYRSRDALQQALLEYVVGFVAADVAELAAELERRPGDVEHAVTATTTTIHRWLEQSDRCKARLELTMAATRDPDLALRLTESRQGLTEVVDGILERGGHDHSGAVAATVVAAVDGVLVSALLQPPEERAAMVSNSLDLLLGSLLGGRPGP